MTIVRGSRGWVALRRLVTVGVFGFVALSAMGSAIPAASGVVSVSGTNNSRITVTDSPIVVSGLEASVPNADGRVIARALLIVVRSNTPWAGTITADLASAAEPLPIGAAASVVLLGSGPTTVASADVCDQEPDEGAPSSSRSATGGRGATIYTLVVCATAGIDYEEGMLMPTVTYSTTQS